MVEPIWNDASTCLNISMSYVTKNEDWEKYKYKVLRQLKNYSRGEIKIKQTDILGW